MIILGLCWSLRDWALPATVSQPNESKELLNKSKEVILQDPALAEH